MRVAFIGDEVTGAGFRLAAIPVHAPAPEEIQQVFSDIRGQCDLVIMTAEYASRLSSKVLDDATSALQPLVAIVPDARGSVAVPDTENAVRRALGIEF